MSDLVEKKKLNELVSTLQPRLTKGGRKTLRRYKQKGNKRKGGASTVSRRSVLPLRGSLSLNPMVHTDMNSTMPNTPIPHNPDITQYLDIIQNIEQLFHFPKKKYVFKITNNSNMEWFITSDTFRTFRSVSLNDSAEIENMRQTNLYHYLGKLKYTGNTDEESIQMSIDGASFPDANISEIGNIIAEHIQTIYNHYIHNQTAELDNYMNSPIFPEHSAEILHKYIRFEEAPQRLVNREKWTMRNIGRKLRESYKRMFGINT